MRLEHRSERRTHLRTGHRTSVGESKEGSKRQCNIDKRGYYDGHQHVTFASIGRMRNNRERNGDDLRQTTTHVLRSVTGDGSANSGANISKNSGFGRKVRREAFGGLEVGRVQVLRTVREEVESSHLKAPIRGAPLY